MAASEIIVPIVPGSEEDDAFVTPDKEVTGAGRNVPGSCGGAPGYGGVASGR
jgi:hypothetical protein